jgi:hypothetical protein
MRPRSLASSNLFPAGIGVANRDRFDGRLRPVRVFRWASRARSTVAVASNGETGSTVNRDAFERFLLWSAALIFAVFERVEKFSSTPAALAFDVISREHHRTTRGSRVPLTSVRHGGRRCCGRRSSRVGWSRCSSAALRLEARRSPIAVVGPHSKVGKRVPPSRLDSFYYAERSP